jgi:two-component system, OmpR family, KDP operon response regulator KdpE
VSSTRSRVLLVDDESSLRTTVRRGLEAFGYDVEVATNGLEAVDLVQRRRPDVVLMDLAMPKMSGLTAIEQIRTWSEVPIIVLSVMGEEADKVRALEVGADDYLTKPFGLQELNARIRVALRHQARQPTDQPYQIGDVSVDLGRRTVTVAGQEVHLTPIEYDLLKHLVLNAGRVLTHQTLLERVWGPEYESEVHYLRPVITSLRKKLGTHLIQTEPGVGYRLKVMLP